MGIHYDYKSTRGAKKMRKQHEKQQRRRHKRVKPEDQISEQSQSQDIKEQRPLTLDMITVPDR